MSQIILDEQLSAQIVLPEIRRWITAIPIHDLHPGERIPDERIPSILLTVAQPTFITIDQGFWDRGLCHPRYCIAHFALVDIQQELIPPLLRALVKLPGFDTRKARMGKVIRVGLNQIEYYEYRANEARRIDWSPQIRKRRRK